MDVNSAYREYEQRTDIEAGRGTLIGRVALEGRAVQIADAWNDPEYMEQDRRDWAACEQCWEFPLSIMESR